MLRAHRWSSRPYLPTEHIVENLSRVFPSLEIDPVEVPEEEEEEAGVVHLLAELGQHHVALLLIVTREQHRRYVPKLLAHLGHVHYKCTNFLAPFYFCTSSLGFLSTPVLMKVLYHLLLCLFFFLLVAAFLQGVEALPQGLHHLRWRFGRLSKQWKHREDVLIPVCTSNNHLEGMHLIIR